MKANIKKKEQSKICQVKFDILKEKEYFRALRVDIELVFIFVGYGYAYKQYTIRNLLMYNIYRWEYICVRKQTQARGIRKKQIKNK